MMQKNDWLEKQLHKQEVAKWTERFANVINNEEWQQVHKSYLQSELWKRIRSRILRRADGQCEKCGAIFISDSALDIHHKNYERVGGSESDDDLEALCTYCHKKADRLREKQTDDKKKDFRLQARINGFGESKYGPDWEFRHDIEDIEDEFFASLYKRYRKKYPNPYEEFEDDENDVPEWFRDAVRDSENDNDLNTYDPY